MTNFGRRLIKTQQWMIVEKMVTCTEINISIWNPFIKYKNRKMLFFPTSYTQPQMNCHKMSIFLCYTFTKYLRTDIDNTE